MLSPGEVGKAIHEDRADALEGLAPAARQQVAGIPETTLQVVKVMPDQLLLVTGVDANALPILGMDSVLAAAPRHRTSQMLRPDFVFLQLAKQSEDGFRKATGVDDPLEVRQLLARVQVGNQLVGHQATLQIRKRPGLRVVDANDFLDEILKGIEVQGETGTGQLGTQRIGGTAARNDPERGCRRIPTARRGNDPAAGRSCPRRRGLSGHGPRQAWAAKTSLTSPERKRGVTITPRLRSGLVKTSIKPIAPGQSSSAIAHDQAVRDKDICLGIDDGLFLFAQVDTFPLDRPAGLVIAGRQTGDNEQLANPHLAVGQIGTSDRLLGNLPRIFAARNAVIPLLIRLPGSPRSVVERRYVDRPGAFWLPWDGCGSDR